MDLASSTSIVQAGVAAFPAAIDMTRGGSHSVPRNAVVKLRMEHLTPAKVNDQIYKPVDPKDPEIRALAASIRNHGLQEPIVVTRDLVILSGHRRCAACSLLGLKEVACRVEAISSDDPGFLAKLVSYNNQRVKSFDEVIREQVVIASDAESPYARLKSHRANRSEVSGEFLAIKGRKRRSKISPQKRPMLDAVIEIVRVRKDWWPLSDRSVHYDLLNDPPPRNARRPDVLYTNDRKCYNDLTDLVTRARIEGYVPFDAISDPTRPVESWNIDRSVDGFVRREMEGFLSCYWRDLMQSQPNHIEILGEKNTVEKSIRGVAEKYTIPYMIGRGYSSIDPVRKMAQRFEKSGKGKLIVLAMSDFDPEGEDIPHAFANQLRYDFGVKDVEVMKVCLTLDQVEERGLPPNNILDEKSEGARLVGFKSKYGEDQSAYELEALSPEERARLLEEAVLSVIDIDAFNREAEREKEDWGRLEEFKRRSLDAMQEILGGRR